MLFICNSKCIICESWTDFVQRNSAGEFMARRKPMEKDLREKAHAMYEEFVKILNSKFRMLRMELTHKRNADCLIKYKDKLLAYAEFEWAARWKVHEFPYGTIHFPSTKAKYAEKDLPVFMITFNRDMTNALIVDAKTMVESHVVPVGRAVSPTGKIATYGERFIDVELSRVVFGLDKLEDYILAKLDLKQ